MIAAQKALDLSRPDNKTKCGHLLDLCSIYIENCANSGMRSCCYTVGTGYMEYLPQLVAELSDNGYIVRDDGFKHSSNYLIHIGW